jgi:hypothetical protein
MGCPWVGEAIMDPHVALTVDAGDFKRLEKGYAARRSPQTMHPPDDSERRTRNRA